MSDETPAHVTASSTTKETRREDLQMLLTQLSETSHSPKLTTDQVTKLIDQRSRVQEYIREDKKEFFELAKIDRTNKLHFLYVGAVAIIILCWIVLKYKPEYFSQLLQAIVTTLGGYGIGRYQGKKEIQEQEKE
ncbi:hypothetical protein HYV70_02300 [Candidatus Uhrbacteria bacterium]|nr:hypothetical protein [Candidatus Uhrbacteria bacterium]